MLTFAAILGAVIGTGIAVYSFWDDLLDFLQECYYTLKDIVNGILQGAKAFIKWLGYQIQEIVKAYSQRPDGKWEETTQTRVIDESEVPPDILARAKANSKAVDITDELELQMVS